MLDFGAEKLGPGIYERDERKECGGAHGPVIIILIL